MYDGPAGLPAGAKLTVLPRDPFKEGPFTIRLIFPANYKISPHWHPTAEHLTVIEGAFYMGTGEKPAMNSTTSLQPGGFALMPAKSVHNAFTKEQAIVHVHGTSPYMITYINKVDDPRNKEKMR
ncbi:cupin domain-containing protein [Pontibacter sp. KCTC 32443]|uniref:cupin domain-containing protein n=1 Tax=Pontibacter TaxID=323449 RepID=UPI00164E185B|nr:MULTISPECIES: cupin domain-containing protein [Pontibacter]MBC5773120.1 cupin domain-containing protein [Pontibacter sp. KCTC 32443]